MSVKNPKLPRFTPRIGNPLYPNLLAELNKVPSPPIAINKSHDFINSLSEHDFIFLLDLLH